MKSRDWLVVVTACLVFLIAACWQISLPGLQYDECIGASPAVNFVRGTANADPMQLRPSIIHIFGRPMPIMQMSYIGPVKMLLYIPLFAVLGISPATVRLLPILAAVASLVLTYFLCCTLFERRAAVFSVSLLALDPSFVFYVTRDVGPAALQILLKLLGLLCFVRWWREGRAWLLCAGALAFGLGVSHKADFVWVIAGLALAVVILARGGFWRRLNVKSVGLGLGSFLLGASPVVAFNLATGAHTFAPFLRGLLRDPGGHLSEFLNHLGQRVLQVSGLLNGELVSRLFSGEASPFAVLRFTLPGALLVSLAVVAVPPFRHRLAAAGRWSIGVLVYLVSVLIMSCFSPTQLSGHHLLALYPMLQIMIALAVAGLGRGAAAMGLRLQTGLVVCLVVVNALNVVSIHGLLGRTGGTGWWSDSIYTLSEDLMQRQRPVAAMDWGFNNNLMVLTQGNLVIEPVYRQFWRYPVSAEVLDDYVDPEWLYLFHSPAHTWYYSVQDEFHRVAKARGYRLVAERTFLQRDGRPVYRLFRLEPSRREGAL